jgi:hypothetical protein
MKIKNLGRLMKFFWGIAVGKRYLLNLKTKEVHDVGDSHKNCHLFQISRYRLIDRKEFIMGVVDGTLNGCRFCGARRFDTDARACNIRTRKPNYNVPKARRGQGCKMCEGRKGARGYDDNRPK